MSRNDNIAYVGLEIQLHGCIRDKNHLDKIIERLKLYLNGLLSPDYGSDIVIDLKESTCLKPSLQES